MKLLVDMFACQTASRFRGIGRYVLSLVKAMAKLRGENEMVVLADALYPESFEALRQEFIRLLPPGCFLPYFHTPTEFNSTNHIQYTKVAETLVKHAYQVISPDVVFTPSPFEGWLDRSLELGVVPTPNNHFYSYNQVAVVYDFIPYIFQDKYLDVYPEYKTWYIEKLNKIQDYNLLLAISESTRQDTIKILGIEPDRVVNIFGAVSSQFRKYTLTHDEKQKLLHHFGISRPFVLNVSAGDFRKNMHGGLRAYAQLPRHIIATHQLVLTYVNGEKPVSQDQLANLGLSNSDVICAENIQDEHLIALYNLCKLFFFPSLYEGFGLPVLEAMACGAPVIASNNSAIPEVVNCSEALFDATDERQITESLYHALTDQPFLEKLAAHGLENSKQFTWENTAQKAWDAIEASQKQREQASKRKIIPVSADKPRMRVAYVSPMNLPIPAISEHGAKLIPLLAEYFDIDVFVEPDVLESMSYANDNLSYLSWEELLDRRNDYAAVVYQVGNSPFLQNIMYLIGKMPGMVILHDFFLNSLYSDGEKDSFLLEMNNNHGLRGFLDTLTHGITSACAKWPMNWTVIKNARALIVYSSNYADLLRKNYAYAGAPTPRLLKQFIEKDDIEDVEDYVAEIYKVIEMDERKLFDPLISALVSVNFPEKIIITAAQKAAANTRLRCRPRALVDVTCIAKYDHGTGIQRVVNNLAREFLNSDDLSLMVDFVRLDGGQLVRASRFVEKLFELPEHTLVQDVLVTIQPGDTLFMLDSSWEDYNQFIPIFERVRCLGGKIVTMVYDLIPIRYPETCHEGVINVFEKWLMSAATESDQLVCISRDVADNLIDFILEKSFSPSHRLTISYIHLGADIPNLTNDYKKCAMVKELSNDKQESIFLMVGTLEPRKGYSFALDAFEQLWQSGYNYRLCFAGKIGWNVAELESRIRNHPELNNRLFLFEKPTDSEIKALYSSATALIAASIAEGFGLPIVEAALHKVPVLASDIPVFREVGGEGAIYFSLESPARLAEAIISFAQLTDNERLAMAEKVNVLTWKQSADWMLKILNGKHPYYYSSA